MEDRVDPELDGTLIDRRCKRVVREGRGTDGFRGVDGLADVGDHHRRVRRGLDVDQPGVAPDRIFPSPRLPRVDETRLPTETRHETCENLYRRCIAASSRNTLTAGDHP